MMSMCYNANKWESQSSGVRETCLFEQTQTLSCGGEIGGAGMKPEALSHNIIQVVQFKS